MIPMTFYGWLKCWIKCLLNEHVLSHEWQDQDANQHILENSGKVQNRCRRCQLWYTPK